ncbi:hypothetical protein [Kiloniella laminariae]|uniref:hypothetical protein n=1 Tax=Kiloniella laminariae TaxID=454162 RepID=UPI0012F7490B|nr:hypothetical protein [Kiloniella laminariae]
MNTRLFTYTLPLLLMGPNAAWSEVCDKEVPSWAPQQGSVDTIDELLFFTTPLGIFLIFLCLVSTRFPNRLLRLSNTAISTLIAAFLLSEWLFPDAVYQSAVQEGCRSSPILVIFALLLIAVAPFVKNRLRSQHL